MRSGLHRERQCGVESRSGEQSSVPGFEHERKDTGSDGSGRRRASVTISARALADVGRVLEGGTSQKSASTSGYSDKWIRTILSPLPELYVTTMLAEQASE